MEIKFTKGDDVKYATNEWQASQFRDAGWVTDEEPRKVGRPKKEKNDE